MQIEKIEIKNFMPFESVELDLSDKQMIGVLGYQNSFDRSNRAGKSSLVEAIAYGLYGWSRAKKVDELFHNGAKELSVKLRFQVKNLVYNLERHRTRNSSVLYLETMGGSTIKEAQQKIDKLMGLNQSQFLATSFFGQEDINRFMDLSSAEKKSFMGAVIGSSRWEEALHLATVRMATLDSNIDELGWQIERHKEISENIESKKATLRVLQPNMNKLKEELEPICKKEEFWKNKLSKIEGKIEVHNLLLRDINKLKEKRAEARHTLEAFKEALKNLEKITRTKMYDKRRTLLKAQSRCTKYKIELSRAKDHLDAFINKGGPAIIKTKKCPILKVYCDKLREAYGLYDVFKQEENSIREQIIHAEKSLHDAEKDVVIRKKEVSSLKQKRVARKANNLAIKDSRSLIEEIEVSLSEKGVKFSEVREEIGDSDKCKKCYHKWAQLRKQKEIEFRDMEKIKIEKQTELRLLEKEFEGIEESKIRFRKLNRILGDYKFLEYAFGKNGIQSLELENLFSTVEDEVNFVLSALELDLRCRFAAERELTTFEKYCPICEEKFVSSICKKCGTKKQKARRDELNLRLLENGEERAFHLDSGGGKLLVSFAIRLALARLIFRRKHVEPSFLILDEVFGALDPTNRENLLNVISKFLPTLGFKQIFIISHTDIKDYLEDVLVVKKKENFSEVGWYN